MKLKASWKDDSIQAGRVWPCTMSYDENMTARNSRWFYVTRRLGDPLVHATGGSSSRTRCYLGVIDLDAVEPGRITDITCIPCASLPTDHLDALTSDGFHL